MRYAMTAALCLLALWGCTPKKQETRLAEQASENQQWDEAYRLWNEVLGREPGNAKAKLSRERARLNAALFHLTKAGVYLERGQLAEAEFETELTLSYDPDNQQAAVLLERIAERRAVLARQEDALARQNEQRSGISNMPAVNPSTMKPLDLKFNEKNPRDIYLSLGRAFGVNIVVDSKIRDDKITIDLKGLNFFKALDALMTLNRHFFKIVDDNTLIILEDSKANRERYDNQIVQTFYLSNITPADLAKHLRQLGGFKEFAENDRLNTITVKGTPEQIALAKKIIDDNDKALPEVVVEIEILEVSKNALRRVGLMPVNPEDPSQSLYRFGVLADPVGRSDDDADRGGVRGFFPSLDDNDFLTILPALAVDFLRTQGDSKQVANPHLRVTSGQQGSVRIGQSIPIAQTSFTNAQISGSASGANQFGDQALTTFDYNDVGIRIEVTPRVHYNNEVTLELNLEISSVLSGGLQPVLGQRQAITVCRLRNGETNVLAGLLTNEERNSLNGIAGLSRIPILGKLFTNDEKVVNQTDIIMTIRPVIVRGPNITSADRAPYEVSNLRLSSLFAEGGESAARQPEQTQRPNAEATPVPTPRPDPPAEPEPDSGDSASNAYPVLPPAGSPEPLRPTPEPEVDESEAAPAMLAFTPMLVEARRDELIEVQLFVANVDDLKRGEIAVAFDPRSLQVESVEIGPMFAGGGAKPYLLPAWDNQLGRLSLIINQRNTLAPFSGSGNIVAVRFRAVGVGGGELAFSTVRLEAMGGGQIPVEGLNAAYEVFP